MDLLKFGGFFIGVLVAGKKTSVQKSLGPNPSHEGPNTLGFGEFWVGNWEISSNGCEDEQKMMVKIQEIPAGRAWKLPTKIKHEKKLGQFFFPKKSAQRKTQSPRASPNRGENQKKTPSNISLYTQSGHLS